MENKYTLEFDESELVTLKLALHAYMNTNGISDNSLSAARLFQKLDLMDRRQQKSRSRES